MKTLVLCGKTATGKTTLAKELEKRFGMRRMITYTTRAPRPGETDGVDYNFLTREKFDRLRSEGFFAETADWDAKEGIRSYGSAARDYEDPTAFTILDPNGIRSLRENGFPITVILLDAEDSVIEERLLRRGDSPEEIRKRKEIDSADFAGIDELVDATLHVSSKSSLRALCLAVVHTMADGYGEDCDG